MEPLIHHSDRPQPPEKRSVAVAHVLLYPLNTVALMFWADQIFLTPVIAFWFITLPFAFAFAFIPYLLLVVVPGMCKPKTAIALGIALSGVLALYFGSSLASRSAKSSWFFFGFAAQLSMIPCFVYAQIKSSAFKLHKFESAEKSAGNS